MLHGALSKILTLWNLLRRQPTLHHNTRNPAETEFDRKSKADWAAPYDDDFGDFLIHINSGSCSHEICERAFASYGSDGAFVSRRFYCAMSAFTPSPSLLNGRLCLRFWDVQEESRQVIIQNDLQLNLLLTSRGEAVVSSIAFSSRLIGGSRSRKASST
jgi:hypothetical protein